MGRGSRDIKNTKLNSSYYNGALCSGWRPYSCQCKKRKCKNVRTGPGDSVTQPDGETEAPSGVDMCPESHTGPVAERGRFHLCSPETQLEALRSLDVIRGSRRPENVFLDNLVTWPVSGTWARIRSWERQSACVWPPVTSGKRLRCEL